MLRQAESTYNIRKSTTLRFKCKFATLPAEEKEAMSLVINYRHRQVLPDNNDPKLEAYLIKATKLQNCLQKGR